MFFIEDDKFDKLKDAKKLPANSETGLTKKFSFIPIPQKKVKLILYALVLSAIHYSAGEYAFNLF